MCMRWCEWPWQADYQLDNLRRIIMRYMYDLVEAWNGLLTSVFLIYTAVNWKHVTWTNLLIMCMFGIGLCHVRWMQYRQHSRFWTSPGFRWAFLFIRSETCLLVKIMFNIWLLACKVLEVVWCLVRFIWWIFVRIRVNGKWWSCIAAGITVKPKIAADKLLSFSLTYLCNKFNNQDFNFFNLSIRLPVKLILDLNTIKGQYLVACP